MSLNEGKVWCPLFSTADYGKNSCRYLIILRTSFVVDLEFINLECECHSIPHLRVAVSMVCHLGEAGSAGVRRLFTQNSR